MSMAMNFERRITIERTVLSALNLSNACEWRIQGLTHSNVRRWCELCKDQELTVAIKDQLNVLVNLLSKSKIYTSHRDLSARNLVDETQINQLLKAITEAIDLTTAH